MMFRSLIASAMLLASSSAVAADYAVDGTHSRVGFSITHLTVSKVRGSFGTMAGTVSYDPKNVAATKVNATVGIASIDTDEAKRDEHLVSPDFFDVAAFPEMKFVSKAVRNIKKDHFELVGDLTIHGVTKEVLFTVNTFSSEVKDPWGNVKVGTYAVAKINRKDFGLTWNAALEAGGLLVGEEVEIELDIQLKKS
jgi:polyisoprenoid-binding protein YceI